MPSSWSKALYVTLFAAASLNEGILFCQTASTPGTLPIRVYLTVSDKKNLPELLSESSLVASIDRRPAQVILLNRADNEKLVFAVLADTSGSNYEHADAIRRAALELFRGFSADCQEGYLITFGVSASATSKPISASQAQKMLETLNFSGGTALFETIKATCETRLARAANPSTPRRVILLLSDGDDNYSRATLAQAENIAQREGIPIFSLSIPSQDVPAAGHVLKELTQATGGRSILERDLVRGAGSLVGLFTAQWAVDLAIRFDTGLPLHPLKITSFQKDVIVSAPSQIALP